MSSFRLHYSDKSPFVRKVHMALIETDMIDVTEMIIANADPASTSGGPIGVNPLGKIPTLETRDGCVLFDSRVILRYLSDFGSKDLYPTARLWDVLTLEATAEGILEAAVLSYPPKFGH